MTQKTVKIGTDVLALVCCPKQNYETPTITLICLANYSDFYIPPQQIDFVGKERLTALRDAINEALTPPTPTIV